MEPLSSPSRHDPVARVIDELRALSNVLDRLDQYAAHRFGLNRTDLRALDLIGHAGAISPTALAAALGMSTGATSAVLDRLEASGYACREQDPQHRRRTIVRVTAATVQLSEEIFGPIIRATAGHAGTLSAKQLRETAGFLSAHRTTLEQYLEAAQP
jgi:DNA-binding MarR family transcriptional regulator